MHPILLMLHPLSHGAAGYWDELANLIPFGIGGLILYGLYTLAQKRRTHPTDPKDADPPDR